MVTYSPIFLSDCWYSNATHKPNKTVLDTRQSIKGRKKCYQGNCQDKKKGSRLEAIKWMFPNANMVIRWTEGLKRCVRNKIPTTQRICFLVARARNVGWVEFHTRNCAKHRQSFQEMVQWDSRGEKFITSRLCSIVTGICRVEKFWKAKLSLNQIGLPEGNWINPPIRQRSVDAIAFATRSLD